MYNKNMFFYSFRNLNIEGNIYVNFSMSMEFFMLTSNIEKNIRLLNKLMSCLPPKPKTWNKF